MMTSLRTVLVALALASAAPAFAWGIYGNTPAPSFGRPPAVNSYPNYMGGYRIEQYGQPTINTYPNYMGGYRIQQYGQPTVNCVPNYMGGMRCN